MISVSSLPSTYKPIIAETGGVSREKRAFMKKSRCRDDGEASITNIIIIALAENLALPLGRSMRMNNHGKLPIKSILAYPNEPALRKGICIKKAALISDNADQGSRRDIAINHDYIFPSSTCPLSTKA